MVAARSNRSATALVLASAGGFATMPILAKVAYAAGASVATVLAYRFVVAALVLWVAVRWLRRAAPAGRAWARATLVLGAVFAVVSLAMFLALERIPAGLASLLFYSYPALVTLGAVLVLRERLSAMRFVLVGMAAAGCLLIFARNAGLSGDGVLLGVALAVCSAVAYTAYILAGSRVSPAVDPLVLAAGVVSVNGVLFGANAVASGELVVDLPAGAWLAMLAIAVVSTALGIGAFLTGVRAIGASKAALLSSVEPVLTVALALTLLGERLAPAQYAGGALIVVAVIGLRLEPRSPGARDQRPEEPAAGDALAAARRERRPRAAALDDRVATAAPRQRS